MYYEYTIKYKNNDEKSFFNFILETDEHYTFVWSDDEVPEESGWTLEELMGIFIQKREVEYGFILHSIRCTAEVKNDSGDTTPQFENPPPSRSSSISEGSFSSKEAEDNSDSISKKECFFNPKSKLAISQTFVLDGALLIGLAIAGLLNAQHIALIMIGLMVCTAIAASSAYYFNPSMN